MNRKARFAVAACLLTGAVGYLMYSGVQQTAVYYLTINEFLAKKDSLANEGIRVAGRVEVGSVTRKMTSSGEELNFRHGRLQDRRSGRQRGHGAGVLRRRHARHVQVRRRQ